MRSPSRVLLGMLVVIGCTQAAQGDSHPGLVGAWRIVETTRTMADSTWVDESPQPGLYLFTDQHFSLMLIPQDVPRTPLSPDASTEERLAAFENFVADAGSYEVSDSILTMRNIIAKLPGAMNGDAGGPYRYRLVGDSLILSFRGGWATGGEITYRLVRLK